MGKQENLKEFIEKIRKETGVPYLDVICYQSHKEIFRYISGENATGKEQLYMYSCSKPITVVSALRLVDDGKISLDDKVSLYLPEIKNAFIIDAFGNKRYVGEEMTLRHLFTMTAGFTYNLSTQPILQLVNDSKGKAVLRDFIAEFVATPLSFAPGTRFQYSICHDVLAAVVEVVTKKKFSEYVKEIVFDPLNMPFSRFDNGEKDVADIYNVDENEAISLCNSEGKILIPSAEYESGGAGLVSTVEDYIRFADTLACGGMTKDGYLLLGTDMLRALATEQIGKISVHNMFTCVQGDDYGYGLGVRVRQKPLDWGLPFGEYGWDGAAGSYVMIDPKNKISVFIGMHLRNWPKVFRGKHLQIVEKIYNEYFKELHLKNGAN